MISGGNMSRQEHSVKIPHTQGTNIDNSRHTITTLARSLQSSIEHSTRERVEGFKWLHIPGGSVLDGWFGWF
jgi:hypothetical protein